MLAINLAGRSRSQGAIDGLHGMPATAGHQGTQADGTRNASFENVSKGQRCRPFAGIGFRYPRPKLKETESSVRIGNQYGEREKRQISANRLCVGFQRTHSCYHGRCIMRSINSGSLLTNAIRNRKQGGVLRARARYMLRVWRQHNSL